MSNSLKNTLLRSTILVGAAAYSLPAFAQATPAEAVDQTAEAEAGAEEIVVTGSLIRNPNLEASAPVSVIGADEIELQQANVAEELLRELPGAVANIGSAVNNGNGGASYVDLRGLGSNRNVVLLDGTRIAPAGLVGRVDLNNIPLALIQRVDSLTGGAATTYGADAVTGVVNFITRKDFAGVEIQASEQITEQGDGNIFRVDTTLGANFDDGRGNAVLSIGYQEADPVSQGNRKVSQNGIGTFDGLVGGSNSPTSVPSRFTVPGRNPQVIGTGGALRDQGTADLFNFAPYNIFQTPFERFNIFGQANYEIADTVELYTRGLFSKNTVETIIAPSGVFASSVTVNVNNPFLPAAARATFCANNDFQHGGANGSGSAAGAVGQLNTPGIQTLTPAECAAAALATGPTDPRYRTFTTTLSRRTTEVGPRISEFVTTIFDYKLGLRGSLTDSLDYDVYGAYGESENIQSLQGYVLTSRARQSLLANSTTTCINTANACTPVDFFGPEGSINAEDAEFLQGDTAVRTLTSLAQVHGQVSGDLGFASPFAEETVGFAVGGEYRKYTADQQPDALSRVAGELGGAGGATPEIHGGFNVKEVFGELIVPLVEDKPFFESLSLEAGIRYSDYEVDAPGSPSFNTTTYKAGANWEPGAGVKFRGTYARAVRAPNISELFSPQNTVLTNLSVDPCQGAAPLTNADLRAVCLAQGAPAFTIGSIPQPAAGQVNITTGGNLALKPEKADTYTVGLVFQPEFLPGFSASLDYYNIKVDGAVAAPLPGDIIAACFANLTAASATDPACTAIGRSPGDGGLSGDPATTPGLFGVLTNLGTLKTDGIDATFNYRRDLGFAELNLGFIGNYTFNQKYQAGPDALNRECTGFYSVNCSFTGSLQPEFQWSQRTTLTFDALDVSLLWRHISKFEQEPDDIENGNGPAFVGTIPGFGQVNMQRVPAYNYFDLTTRLSVTDMISVTFSVINLTDKKPPLLGGNIGSTTYNSGNTYPSTYDALGRRFAISTRVRF
jgi:outer membrane receptor protein involved in Fe transport